MGDDTLYGELVRAAYDFFELRLWRRLDPRALYAVELPRRDTALFACIMGQGAEAFGLTALRGPRAQQQLIEMMRPSESDHPAEDLAEEMDYLACSTGRFGDLQPEEAQRLTAAGWDTLGPEDMVPEFLVKPPHQQLRAPDATDVREMLYVLRGTLKAHRDGAFAPRPAPGGAKVLTLTLTGPPEDPEVRCRHKKHPLAAEPPAPQPPGWAWSLKNLPRRDETWLIAWPGVPAQIEDDPRSMRVLLVVDRDSRFVYQATPLASDELDKAVALLGETFHGENAAKRAGVPARALISSKALHRAVAPAMEAAGVPCEYREHLPELDDLLAELFDVLSGGMSGGGMPDGDELSALAEELAEDPQAAEALDEITAHLMDDPEALERVQELMGTLLGDEAADEADDGPLAALGGLLDDALEGREEQDEGEGEADAVADGQRLAWDELPAADDLAMWKKVDRAVASGLHLRAEQDRRYAGSRAAKRYFRHDDIEASFERFGGAMPRQAYVYWFFLSYRGTKNSRTPAEELLQDEDLPAAFESVLRALTETPPSIYRVDAHDAEGGTLRLSDVLLGGEVTVHDASLAASCSDGWLFAARCYPAGAFRFLVPAGPAVDEMLAVPLTDALSGFGVTYTRQGLLGEANKFGWLWQWLEDFRQEAGGDIDLRNTDGEELIWQTASFGIENPDAVRRHLDARDDVDYDADNDEFVWVGPLAEDSMAAGDTVTLGRIELLDEELVLTVNSAERLARGRQWLGALPGVRFIDVTTRRWDEPDEDRPLDETIDPPESPEVTEEMAGELRQMVEGQYMRWLDKPLPELDGKSPRQMCRTAEGRRRVAVFIRSIPDPSGPVPLQVPRRRMLRELGLDE